MIGQFPATVESDKDTTATVAQSYVEWALRRYALQLKVGTVAKMLALRRRAGLDMRRNWPNRAARKIGARQRLLDVQLPRLACLGIDAVPIVEPKRHVAVLLYFEKDHAAAERMDCAGFEKDAVARLGRE